jgi:hypothetical protein
VKLKNIKAVFFLARQSLLGHGDTDHETDLNRYSESLQGSHP